MKEDFANNKVWNAISLYPSRTERSHPLENCYKQIVFTGNILVGPALECVVLEIGVTAAGKGLYKAI